MTEDESGQLFHLPAPKPLTAPRELASGQGKVTYTGYSAKHPQRCDDCMQVSLEANRSDNVAPLARKARFVRAQGGLKLLLCAEHKQLREQAEEPSSGARSA